MPILIVLKNPRVNLFAEGEIKDDEQQHYDEIFHNQVLMVKNRKGRNQLIPLLQDCNIAVMETVTDEEIDEQEKELEKRRKQAESQGGKGGLISKSGFVIPSNRGGIG